MNDNLILINNDKGICTITINSPENLNALNSDIIDKLNYAVDKVSEDQSILVVVITGAGRAFVAGADIAQMSQMSASEGKEFGRKGSELFRKIELLPKPVIAAVNGFALGGGCELAMACDIRIASEKAKFGQPEVTLGITPGFSGTLRLPRLVGTGIAKELLFTGKIIDAAQALKIGLVNEVTEPDALLTKAYELASLIVSKTAPKAVQFAKESVNTGTEIDMDSAIQLENSLFGLCFSTEDQKEGMKAFLEKREAKFINK